MKWLEYLKILPLLLIYILGIVFFGTIALVLLPFVFLIRFFRTKEFD